MIRVKEMNKLVGVARPERIGLVGLENVCRSWSSNRQSTLLTEKFHPRDDDDEFLYGDSELKDSSLSKVPPALVVAPVLVPSPGETPLLVLCPPTRFVFYSSQRNIIVILLTASLRARQLNRMSEFSNFANLRVHLSHVAFRTP